MNICLLNEGHEGSSESMPVNRFIQVVVEPSGAAAVAAALSPQLKQLPEWESLQRIGIILSGGNIDIAAKGFWQVWNVS